MSGSTILITGAAGFIGQQLAPALLAAHEVKKLVLTDIVKPAKPQPPTYSKTEIESIKADLTNPSALEALFTSELDTVFLLHGLMSGAAETDLDLGLRINVDATRAVLDRLRQVRPGARVVFASSCAVHSLPLDGRPVRDDALPRPTGSYGAQKLIIEVLLHDYARRGLLDGRAVRLPTVIVRPGKPSGAASSFCSGIFREPLAGQSAALTVRRELEIWVGSTRNVVRNLMRVMELSAEEYGEGVVGLARTVNLPGITVTVDEMLEALEAVGGKEARSLVREERDEGVEEIVYSWARRFETERASKLDLAEDVDLVEIVKQYVRDFGQQV